MFEGSNNNGGLGEKYLLLQTGYHPDHQSQSSTSSNNTATTTTRPTTSPPSPTPTPCYATTPTVTTEDRRRATTTDADEDLLSITSKESYHSNHYRPNRHYSQQYDFLKYDKDDDFLASLPKRKVFIIPCLSNYYLH
jgi:hypothetical protein